MAAGEIGLSLLLSTLLKNTMGNVTHAHGMRGFLAVQSVPMPISGAFWQCKVSPCPCIGGELHNSTSIVHQKNTSVHPARCTMVHEHCAPTQVALPIWLVSTMLHWWFTIVVHHREWSIFTEA